MQSASTPTFADYLDLTMFSVLDYVNPEEWLACPAERWATPQRYALVCLFNTAFPGFWLAIVWSLAFLVYSSQQRPTRKDEMHFEKNAPVAIHTATEEYSRSYRSIVFGAPAILIPLAGGVWITSFLTSTIGWRWMILGAHATPPRVISMSYMMGLIYFIISTSTLDKHVKLAAPAVVLRSEAARAFRISGWLVSSQIALYLFLLYVPGARWYFRSGLFYMISLLGIAN